MLLQLQTRMMYMSAISLASNRNIVIMQYTSAALRCLRSSASLSFNSFKSLSKFTVFLSASNASHSFLSLRSRSHSARRACRYQAANVCHLITIPACLSQTNGTRRPQTKQSSLQILQMTMTELSEYMFHMPRCAIQTYARTYAYTRAFTRARTYALTRAHT
jgi:hypothetical protein